MRQDLYYRLQASVIHIPPLRERLGDIPLLVEHFIDLFNARQTRPTPIAGIEEDALMAMRQYRWPGNVRALANSIESAFTFSRSPTIRLCDLPHSVGGATICPEHPAAVQSLPIGSYAESERAIIKRALETSEGNKVRAAKLLRISRKKLYVKIAKYEIEWPTP